MNLLQTVCGSEVSFYKELSDFIYKTWKKDKKRGKSCLISFCNCTKSDLFLTMLASVVSPRVMLSGLACGAAASGCLCAGGRSCCRHGPRARPGDWLGTSWKSAEGFWHAGRAAAVLEGKAEWQLRGSGGARLGDAAPRGGSAGSSCGAAAATGCYLSGEALCWWSRGTRESCPSLGETD